MFGLFDSETLIKRISGDSDFEWNGVKYPAIWIRRSTVEEKAAIGMRELPPEPTWDERFYWSIGNPKLLNDREEVDQDGNPMYVKVLGEVNGEPAMVDSTERLITKGLKSQWTAQVKDTAGKMLAQTDWMVVRKAERNVDIPATVVAKRAAIVAECDRLETAIAACTTVEALIAVVGAQAWGE
jgi:hypothetical protein